MKAGIAEVSRDDTVSIVCCAAMAALSALSVTHKGVLHHIRPIDISIGLFLRLAERVGDGWVVGVIRLLQMLCPYASRLRSLNRNSTDWVSEPVAIAFLTRCRYC